MFASILSVAHHLGYPTLVLLVMLESGGVPLPGETALITAQRWPASNGYRSPW
jgi:membrane protein DedA with SNARE-associated domain